MKIKSQYKVALITGGTGGHIFPAIALAEELHELKHDSLILADKRFRNYLSQMPKWLDYRIVSSGSLNGGLFRKIFSLVKIFFGIICSLKIFLEYKPNVVVGFGGYISLPPVIAARILRIPVILHEQNSVIGKANQFLKDMSEYITVTFKDTIGVDMTKSKVRIVGNPVRKQILKYATSYTPISIKGDINILITGGSQGASIFSKVLPKALSLLDADLIKRLKIYHQCRAEDLEQVKFKYEKNNINAVVSKFFDNIPELISKSQLVISRAGASIISELIAIGRPTIFIPIQRSIGNHQFLNAKVLADKEAAWIINEPELSPEFCTNLLGKLLKNPDLLTKAAHNSKSLYNTADDNLVDLVLDCCKNKTIEKK